jgi:opacity protein-like surface antigen
MAAGSYLAAVTADVVTATGAQRLKPAGFAAGIEGGYNWQAGNLVFGIEADLQSLHLNSAGTSHADYGMVPGSPADSFTVTSYGNANWMFTARPRIGFVTPNQWLFYVTGGLALTRLQTDFSFIDGYGASESGRLNTVKAGYAVGGGVEVPLTDRFSVKADYLHVEFANTAGAVTANTIDQVFTHSGDLRADIVRAGLNYRFGGADPAAGSAPIPWLKAPVGNGSQAVNTDWSVEAGTRVWFSTGVDREGPLFNAQPFRLASRLIYGGLDAVSGEAFARVDHVSGFFAKGYLGAGGIHNGQLNDEDFPGNERVNTYSNTRHDASGHIGYATIDLGYNFLRAPGAKVGAFVGYNYYAQAINTYGCAQLADGGICAPPLPSSLLVLTNNDHFNSLRVGLSSQLMLTDRLRLTGDAAYVPWVDYTGLDNHLLRQLLGPDASNSGTGVMLEAVLDYRVSDAWSVGVGGRYWAWHMNTGTAGFNYLATPASNSVAPQGASAERYGVFVQSSYRWGDPNPSAGGSNLPAKAPALAMGPMNWSGFYVGGHLGGGRSDNRWSDPFGSTVGGLNHINVAGFGDKTRAGGPLGGGQVGINWQTGSWVLGVQADISAAKMRGEDTCFSGIGGVNCEHTLDAIGTFTGRIGYAWGRALAYAKAGGAWSRTNYELLADTNVLRLGSGSTVVDTWGWVVGGGVEYAVTSHWTAFAEYNHIGLPSTTVSFPTVAVIGAETINARQDVDLFKLGVNYKFNFASMAAMAH